MWHDNETDLDFLNFSVIADTVGQLIQDMRGDPISIGVSGAWGAGKSSMLRLVRKSIEAAQRNRRAEESRFVFVEFNAWLYQGYDDARAALVETIAQRLADEAKTQGKASDAVKQLIERVSWFRVAKYAGAAVGAFANLPAPILLGILGLAAPTNSTPSASPGSTVGQVAQKLGLLDPALDRSPPKEINSLRESIEKTLSELNITLVVLIDDLDRCLPATTIATLEGIRLFLFLKNTAFVIAADMDMIKHAVRRHFEGINDEVLITNYFDKLVQVPIRVPPLGTQEIRAYMIMLHVQVSKVDIRVKTEILKSILKQLRESWQGKRVDRAFIQALQHDIPAELNSKLESAERLAHLMATAPGIQGNPRLVKRFLNALSIRMAMAKTQGVSVEESQLAKLLLFERLGTPQCYTELVSAVSSSADGVPAFLADLEAAAANGEIVSKAGWDHPFVIEWLKLHPPFSGSDLRGALYVSREHAPLITPQDRLSSKAVEILEALLKTPAEAESLGDELKKIPIPDLEVIMGRLLEVAQKEQEWGTPAILTACLAVSAVAQGEQQRLSAFLIDRPPAQIKPNIVPKIKDCPWSDQVFEAWGKSNASEFVKKAIKAIRSQKKVQ